MGWDVERHIRNSGSSYAIGYFPYKRGGGTESWGCDGGAGVAVDD